MLGLPSRVTYSGAGVRDDEGGKRGSGEDAPTRPAATYRRVRRFEDYELQREKILMRRTALAAAWVFGATVPLLGAVVFVFGCCVLPFHGYIHKAMPFCHAAMQVITPEHDDLHGAAQQQMPARAKQEPVKRITTELPRTIRVSITQASSRLGMTATTAYRSFISLGALRCDQDVGLHLLAGTLLI